MLIKSESLCPQFVANDGCKVRELMHPKNDGIDLAFSLAIAEVEPGHRTFRHRLSHLNNNEKMIFLTQRSVT